MIRKIKDAVKTIIAEVKEEMESLSESCEEVEHEQEDKETSEVEAPQPAKKKKAKQQKQELLIIDPSALLGEQKPQPEIDLSVVGLFSDVDEEKVAELVHGLLVLNEMNKQKPEEERKPIDFYVCTHGGSVYDMFALYDIMAMVKEHTAISTIGVGKVMSAGTLILAAGTKGQRKIGRNCRVMLHNVGGGGFGILPSMVNQIEEMTSLQEQYIRCLSENSKLSKKKLIKMLNQKMDIYLSAEEAVEYGIADIIV